MRTDSTTVLGCTPPDPYQAPVEEALPLASQPHLLHPTARREQMFGTIQEHSDSGRGGAPMVSSMALSREGPESVVCTTRPTSGAAAGQLWSAMDVNSKAFCNESPNPPSPSPLFPPPPPQKKIHFNRKMCLYSSDAKSARNCYLKPFSRQLFKLIVPFLPFTI